MVNLHVVDLLLFLGGIPQSQQQLYLCGVSMLWPKGHLFRPHCMNVARTSIKHARLTFGS